MAEGDKHEAHCSWFFTGAAICGPVQKSHNWHVDMLMRSQDNRLLLIIGFFRSNDQSAGTMHFENETSAAPVDQE